MIKYNLILLTIILCCFACAPENKSEENITSEQNTVDPFETINSKIAESPSNADLYYERAQLHLNFRKVELAENDALKALSLDSTKARYYIAMSDVHFAKNQAFKAKAMLDKALVLEQDNTDALLRMAEIHLIVKKHPESISFLDRTLRVDKHNAKAYFMKGMNFKEMFDTSKAISSFQTCIEQDPQYYDAFMQLGIIMEARNSPLALEYFNGAMTIKPGSEEALYGKGLFYQNNADFDNAIITYTEILKLNPCHLDAHFNLGYIHYVNLKVYRQAIKHYDDAIACNKSFLKAYYNRGLAYEALGDEGNAMKSYVAALEVDPNYTYAQQGIIRLNR